MSVLRCDNCSRLIDTDFDVEAYSPKLDEWWCPPCRANWRGWDDEEDETKND